MPAIGIPLGERSAAIFLGGEPLLESLEEAGALLRLITVGLTCERTLAFAGMQVQLARRATQESSALAASLDEARRAAQAEVAARKEVEQALREARDELARANADLEIRVRERTLKLEESVRELEAFSYTVSHDLRAPLRAMYGYADVLLKDAGARLSAEERGYLNRIGLAGRRLDRMIQDVLHYSRISQAEITLAPIALDRVVQAVIAEYPMLRNSATHVEVRPPLGEVLGHEMLLSQCIANLLLNAVKFVAPGVDPYVQVYTERRGSIIRLWIVDNGIGIETQHMNRLFGMFERIHPSSSFEGNGIGLAIVKRAVHRLGGDVGVESVAGTGSRFWLDLQAPTAAPGQRDALASTP
jgi:signal transduction histidine kinase